MEANFVFNRLAPAKARLVEWAKETEQDFRDTVQALVDQDAVSGEDFAAALHVLKTLTGRDVPAFASGADLSHNAVALWLSKRDLPRPEVRGQLLGYLMAIYFHDQIPVEQVIRLARVNGIPEIGPALASNDAILQPVDVVQKSELSVGDTVFDLYQDLETFFNNNPLSVRLHRGLKSYRIQYLGQLLALTEAEFLQIPNLGRTSLNELRGHLIERGLSLEMSPVLYPQLQEFRQALTIHCGIVDDELLAMVQNSTVKGDLERAGLEKVHCLVLIPREEVIEKLGERNDRFIHALEAMLKRHDLELGMVLPDALIEVHGWE